MGRKISLVALSAVISLTTLNPAIGQENGTFYVELVGPDEVVGEPEQQVYGPVRSNDTLWAIASLNRPSRSVSVYQMMYAILQKNPQAFNNGNVNSVINGSYLTLPTLDEAQSVSHQMAVAAIAPKKKAVVATTPPATTTATTVVAVAPAATQAVTKPADAAALEQTQQNLDTLRDRLESRIDELEQLKRQEFDVLKQQMDESSQQMVGLAEVNHRMKMRIQELSDELASIRDELNENRRNQTQILQLLEKPKLEESEMNKDASGLSSFLSSPLNIGLAIFIPLLLIALVITLMFRRKAKRELEEQDKEMAESTLNLMDDENDEFSQLFSDNLEPEDEQAPDLNEQFENDQFDSEPDLSLDEPIAETNSFEDDVDDLEPEIEEASFEDFAAIQEDSIPEISLDDSEMSALDAFESDDLVPSLDDAEPAGNEQVEDDLNSVISADDLAAALSMDDEQDLFEVSSSDDIDDADELSFEDALKQQQNMEAELSEVSQQEKFDLDNIDLSDSTEDDDFDSLSADESSLEDLTAELEDTIESASSSDENESASFDLDDDVVDLSSIELDDPSAVADDFASQLDNEEPTTEPDVSELHLTPKGDDTAELAELEKANEDDSAPVTDDDIDSMFASFGSDAFSESAEPNASDDLPSRSDIEEREFVDIDMLLNEADEGASDDSDPYDQPSLDVELDSFPDILPEGKSVDVDMNAELASKLDLARAYLEIDDQDGAKKILQEVLVSDDQKLKQEAEELLARFS
ncbi:hypothetical protein M0C34_12045 [Agarivorans sp. TSD2052]|uniref:FimV/HubP family polar landmark protein n=1 Tax=Agarivorans sp. TSD2052 TaxID=2937286 RepID=UPI00200FDB3F|nr:FimV/HubP family polar landmark protein [Agarivorans sp. TSD2052]UPW16978.1 hypothetical protein M0C34_12045 [Agarivorans sp. TSD2052]